MLAPRKTLHSTPLSIFRRALELVHVDTSDVVYDLGCGDGRLLIEAALSFGVRAVGVEIDSKRVQQARDAAKANGVEHLVTVHEANALEYRIPVEATIVFLFLISRGLSLVRPKLEKLQACRVITYLYLIPGLMPLEKHYLSAREPVRNKREATIEAEFGKYSAGLIDVVFPVYFYHFPTLTQSAKNLP
ncbi:FAM173 family [Plasmopara halstedii]|uniref:FAM173 family n=1 Tax=Plasmopara halstedii TaxID=4781 RepID=A0A0P1A5C6_PLAHL|nr:FAM173 family [Plasmopara halstedii]CEG35184.1 FAM173 family [Plasmopara halstedii]|eukprot:XP_024571553.1 FAM173 family [Plasmopara halstedii]